MRILRTLAWTGLLIVALLVVVAAAAWWFVTPERIRTSLEAQATQAIGLPTHIERLSVSWFPQVALQLENVRIGEPARLTASELDVSAGLRGLLSRRVEEATLTIRKSRLDLPSLLQLVARITHAPHGAGASAGPAALSIVSVRSIALDDVTLVAGAHEIAASATGEIERPGQLTLRSLQAHAPGTKLDASGTIAFGPPAIVQFEARATELDVNGLLAFVTAATSGGPEAPSSGGTAAGAAPRVEIRVTADRGVLGTIAFTGLSTRVTMAGPATSLDPLSARVFGGSLGGRLTYAAAGPEVRINGSLDGADVAALLHWMGKADEPVTGRLNASVDLGARQAMLTPESWRGSARLTMTDGEIRGLSVVRSSVVALAGRKPSGSVTGTDRYERMTGSFAIDGRVIRSRDLRLASPDMDLRGEGTITMPAGALDVRADCLLSETLSSQAGRDLYRYAREGDRIVIPIAIGGALGDPRVSLRADEAIQRAIRRTIEDEAGSLLDRLLKPKK